MVHPIWVLAFIVNSCAVAEFSSEIVVASGENSAASWENKSGEVSLAELVSPELLDTSQPRIQPVVSYKPPKVVQFPIFDTYSKNGEPVLKYYKRYIITPKIKAASLRPKSFLRDERPNSLQIKRVFMTNKPIFMPRFVYSERPEFIYTRPPATSPIIRSVRPLSPIIAQKMNGMIISNPIRTAPEYAQMLSNKPRIPDYIYQQPAVSQSVKIPTFVRAPGAFLYAHANHAAFHRPRLPTAVPQQHNPVKWTQQQSHYQPTIIGSSPTAAVPVKSAPSVNLHNFQPHNVLPPQALVGHKQSVSQNAPQQVAATHYQPVQYKVHDSLKENTEELPVAEPNADQKPSYVKVLLSTGEQFVPVPEPSMKYVLTGQRLVYKSPQPQTVYVAHQPQYSALIAQPPIDGTPQYVASNQDVTRYSTINQVAPQIEPFSINSPYVQSYAPSSAEYRTTDISQNYRTIDSDHLLSALRAHTVMAHYPVAEDPQDIIVGTTKNQDSSEQDTSIISTGDFSKNSGLWSTFTAAVNVNSDYDVSKVKDGSYNAIIEVPAPKLAGSMT